MSTIYKSSHDIKTVEEMAEKLKTILGDKYSVEVNKKDKGLKKMFTNNDTDFVTVKKNAYHGVSVMVYPKSDGLDYITIVSDGVTPGMVAYQLADQLGMIGGFVCRMIWGSGKEFYAEIDKLVVEKFDAKEVDNSFKNQMKSLFKGKSVMDE